MLTTYKALLRGDRLEWTSDAPPALPGEQAIPVQVTILEDVTITRAESGRGQRMAAILEQLAAIHTFANIADPVQWQRDLRQDRALPERDT